MVSERALVVTFLAVTILLSIIFIIVKLNREDPDEDEDFGFGSTPLPSLCPCKNGDSAEIDHSATPESGNSNNNKTLISDHSYLFYTTIKM